jgi:hypothetical protein
VVAAAFNVNMNTQSSDMSDLSLANVEALAQESGGGYGAQSIIIVDKGRRIDCVNNTQIIIEKYDVTCLGRGNLQCTPGGYERMTRGGYCAYV